MTSGAKSDHVKVYDVEAVRVIELSRPDRLNAMTEAMFDAVTSALVDASSDSTVGCVVMTGAGRAFSAGWDMSEMDTSSTRPPDGRRHGPVPCIEELMRFTKPLLCAVNGIAVGFGATTPLHADVAIASTQARFRFPFAELGLAGESAVTSTLPMRIGFHHAARLLLTCDWVDAAEALELGLIWKVVAPEQLMTEALAVAKRIAAHPIEATVATKKLLVAAKSAAVGAAFDREVECFERLLGAPANLAAIERFTRGATTV